jgi:hypothetical protein
MGSTYNHFALGSELRGRHIMNRVARWRSISCGLVRDPIKES